MKSVKVHLGRAAGIAIATRFAVSPSLPSNAFGDSPYGGQEGTTDPGPGPLTAEDQAALGAKVAQVHVLLGNAWARSGGIAPQSVPCEPGQPPPCLPLQSSYILATHARHQHRSFYCGPATVQVVSNYTWGYTETSECGAHCSGNNKYGQHEISDDWTKTDLHGETYVGDLRYGLNQASDRPGIFVYEYGTDLSWEAFHDDIIVDTWWWHMPLAARVDPKDDDTDYFLTSWATVPAGEYGHWITLRGYTGDVQSTARVYYNDSSGGVDEHTGVRIYGDTGAFNDKSYTVYRTMKSNKAGDHYYLIW
jgi:hypothetical protein